ncbi:hypothetical protein AcW1_002384 [Taiwanofungus camphoratus]|nr:hypothetical protein AcV5_010392 [Antrodia cinnamomea]KAI0944748.1 hypothetical protein AcW1_002384 [Antrodia cinnamomea]
MPLRPTIPESTVYAYLPTKTRAKFFATITHIRAQTLLYPGIEQMFPCHGRAFDFQRYLTSTFPGGQSETSEKYLFSSKSEFMALSLFISLGPHYLFNAYIVT